MSFTGLTKRTMPWMRAHECQQWWSKTLAVTGLVVLCVAGAKRFA